MGFPNGSDGKRSVCNAGDRGSNPGSGISLGEGNATYSSILAWRILWTEEPDKLWSIGSQRVGHNWSNLACLKKWRMGLAQPGGRLGEVEVEEERFCNVRRSKLGITSLCLTLSFCLHTHTHTHTQNTHIKMDKHTTHNQDFSYPWCFPSMNFLQ